MLAGMQEYKIFLVRIFLYSGNVLLSKSQSMIRELKCMIVILKYL